MSVGVAEALAGARVVETDGLLDEADGLEEIEGADTDSLECLNGLLKRKTHRALPGKIVDLGGAGLENYLEDAPEVGDGHGFQAYFPIDTESPEISERRHLGVAGGSKDLVALGEKEAREICAVLSGDAADESPSKPGFLRARVSDDHRGRWRFCAARRSDLICVATVTGGSGKTLLTGAMIL